jgi:hypothetical protein
MTAFWMRRFELECAGLAAALPKAPSACGMDPDLILALHPGLSILVLQALIRRGDRLAVDLRNVGMQERRRLLCICRLFLQLRHLGPELLHMLNHGFDRTDSLGSASRSREGAATISQLKIPQLRAGSPLPGRSSRLGLQPNTHAWLDARGGLLRVDT